LNQAADEGRQLMRFIEGLPEAETVDVVETLEKTCELLTRKASSGRPRIIFQSPAQPWPRMSPKTAWSVVRIIQQAAVNAVRHSGADLLVVSLGGTGDSALTVLVRDDGHGFDPGKEYPGHYGLSSMRQRARELGMNLSIESRCGGDGTRVSLRIPAAALKAAEEAAEDLGGTGP
jgi:signal transduction histidine kinase